MAQLDRQNAEVNRQIETEANLACAAPYIGAIAGFVLGSQQGGLLRALFTAGLGYYAGTLYHDFQGFPDSSPPRCNGWRAQF